MKTAVVVAPGRGTYNAAELGYLARHHGDKADLLAGFDAQRRAAGRETVTALDGADRFSPSVHTRGDNASPLIYACAYGDFLSIDREAVEVVAVTGNSMGWYIALACAGALDAAGGMTVVDTMGALMQERLIGGQLVHPVFAPDWTEPEGARAALMARIDAIDAREGHELALSIDLGGMLAIAGNEAGLAAFVAETPAQDRFPMRLKNHAAFHTPMQAPVAEEGRRRLPPDLFGQPDLPLIDGRGAIWRPGSTDLAALRAYTLGAQVVEPYDFAAAIRVAAREFMPDMFIVLGPGDTLGGAVAQSLIRARWRGWGGKADFQAAQADGLRLVSMGRVEQRGTVGRS